MDVAVPVGVMVPAVAFAVPLGVADMVGDTAAVVIGRLAVGVTVLDCCSARAVEERGETAARTALRAARTSRRRNAPTRAIRSRFISLSCHFIRGVPCYHALRDYFTIRLHMSGELLPVPWITIGRYDADRVSITERSRCHGGDQGIG
jgi:hypothetical protein